MAEPAQEPFTIVGAGLAGPLMACFLARAGHPVTLYEKRPDPRRGPVDRGRSINLALSERGIRALAAVGAAERVLRSATPMRGRLVHHPDGSTAFQPYGTEPRHAINSVSRLGLNVELLNLAESLPNVRLHFERTCVDIDLDTPALTLRDRRTGRTDRVEARRVIAADGAFSVVRRRLERLDRFNYEQLYLEHGYKELEIPAGPDGRHRLDPHVLHIWPRRRFMMIALANPDGSFTCTLFWPFEGEVSFATVRTPAEIEACFARHFPDAVPLMPNLVEDYQRNPTSSLVTIRCFPWHHRDRVVLLGDACHAVVPFYGQGMNAAFEDCSWLARALREHPDDYEAAFAAYARRRKADVDALSYLALQNFVEMRDKVASRWFLLGKAAERTLHRWFPRWFVPLYQLVTFTTMPYREAVRRAARQKWFFLTLGLGLAVALLNLVLLTLLFFLA